MNSLIYTGTYINIYSAAVLRPWWHAPKTSPHCHQ